MTEFLGYLAYCLIVAGYWAVGKAQGALSWADQWRDTAGSKGRGHATDPVAPQDASAVAARPALYWFPGWLPEEEAEARAMEDLRERTWLAFCHDQQRKRLANYDRMLSDIFKASPLPFRSTWRPSPVVSLSRFDGADAGLLAEVETRWKLRDQQIGYCPECHTNHAEDEPCDELGDGDLLDDMEQERERKEKTGEESDD